MLTNSVCIREFVAFHPPWVRWLAQAARTAAVYSEGMLGVLAALLLLVLPAAAQKTSTAGDIAALIRAGLQAKRSDAKIARSLRSIRPSERVDEDLIEALEGDGAGPQTVAELERLRAISRGLPAPRSAQELPPLDAPPLEEQRRVLANAREAALEYSRSLPDFICTQRVRRYDDIPGAWRLKDTLEVKLSYFEQKEDYQLLTVNGRSSFRDYETVGGAVSEGEFGSLLRGIFLPQSDSEFRWERWTMLRGRTAHVFAFRVQPERSSYRIAYLSGLGANRHDTPTGQHGLVFLDSETHRTLRIVADADHIPEDFPVRAVTTVLDFASAAIGSQSWLLPLRAEVRMTMTQFQTRNLVEFRGYRKFGSESRITFDQK